MDRRARGTHRAVFRKITKSATSHAATRMNRPAATLTEGCGQMTLDSATELIRHSLILTLIVSAPLLTVALIVGLITSVLQAATQVQEQSLSVIPKIAAILAAAIVLLPWMGQHLIEYARQMFAGG